MLYPIVGILLLTFALEAIGGEKNNKGKPFQQGAQEIFLTFDTSRDSLAPGEAATLTWAASGARSCTASADWEGRVATSGSRSTGPMQQTGEYVLTCTNKSGDQARQRLTISVISPESEPAIEPSPEPAPETSESPVASLTSEVQQVMVGAYIDLSWSSAHAEHCTAGGDWSGQKGPSGKETVGPIVRSSTFSLSCSGAGGEAIALTGIRALGTVTVSWVPPTANVDGSPVTGIAGYRIHRGDTPGESHEVVEVDGALNSTVLIAEVGPVYVWMTAVDAEGHESSASNQVQLSVM